MLKETGKDLAVMMTDTPMTYAGGGFPWGLLIIGGIVYLLWRNGMFDGRGRFGNGPRNGGGYGGGYGSGSGSGQAQMTEAPGYGSGSGQGNSAGFGDPRAQFEEWHRQMHESAGAQAHSPAAPPAPPAPAPEAPASGNGEPAR